MSKILKMTFNTQGNNTMDVTLEVPAADLTEEIIKEKAAAIIPVLQTRSGLNAISLASASYIETTATKIC